MEHIRAVEEGSGNNDWVSRIIIGHLVVIYYLFYEGQSKTGWSSEM